MKRLATLLTIAGITLVGYTGAMYAILSQEMPDSAPEPVYSVQSEPEESETAEAIIAEKPPEPAHTVIVTHDPSNEVLAPPSDQEAKLSKPYWLKYIEAESLKGGFYLSAYICIIEWEKNLVPIKAHALMRVSEFMMSDDTTKDATVVDTFAHTVANQPCADMLL